MILNDLLASDAYTPVNKKIARELGFIVAGYLGELIRQRKRFGKEEFFFSQSQMINELGISEYEQRQAVRKLTQGGLLKVIKKGMPCKNWFKIEDSAVLKFLGTSTENTEAQVLKNLGTSTENTEAHNKNNNNNIIIKGKKSSSATISEMTPRQELQEKVNKILSDKKVPSARTDKARIALEFYMKLRKAPVRDLQFYLDNLQKLLGTIDLKDVLGAMWICHHTKFSRGLQGTGKWKWDINYLFRKGKIDQAYKWEGDVINELVDENSKKLEKEFGYLFTATYEKQKITTVIDVRTNEQLDEDERIQSLANEKMFAELSNT